MCICFVLLLCSYLGVVGYCSGHDYYSHGRDGRKIYLILVCCLFVFDSIFICLPRRIRNFDQAMTKFCDDLRDNMGPVHTLDDLFIFYFEIWDLDVDGFAGLRAILVFGILAATLFRSSCRSCPLFLFERLAMHIIGDRLYFKINGNDSRRRLNFIWPQTPHATLSGVTCTFTSCPYSETF